jgi:hydrocephalus-inducing protein
MFERTLIDLCRLEDGPIGKVQQQVFMLRNHSTKHSFRFRWPAVASNYSLSFSPSSGHLLPGSCKDVVLSFKPEAPIKMSPQEIKVSVVQISHQENAQAVDWDDRSTVIEYDADNKPLARPEPEPKVTEVNGTAKELSLKVFAVADNPRFECDTKPIQFRPTTMFQTRR